MPSTAEAAENADDVTRSDGELRCSEGGIVARADRDGVAVLVNEVVRAIAAVFSEVGLAAISEVDTDEAYNRELVGIGVVRELRDVGEFFEFHFAFVGPAVAVDVLFEGVR